ncbi:uracil-DNA glycosylase [Niveispirillum sp. BGYR6]|uniref:uracil-DNA glycosylase n=1 Tax=Niveispirillum sp. BGYR6 TaxID=2971249 RepID=UPI0022B94DA6|nr:uracil-DNA glycosylase [Niveispirillum sp. BGYR6]MDG5495006.1 uracil-DNA glycosylase [Niveispirillum sp. BGYR6]
MVSTAASRVPAPGRDCGLCPRLAEFRQTNRATFPSYHNAPVPSFGTLDGRLLIVGLAPGLHGANQTGRPFTGDYAGDLLYDTLIRYGFARGQYDRRPDDGLELLDCRLTNAARCVPPENKPTPAEIASCRPFLVGEISAMPRLRAVVALGTVSHNSTLTAFGLRPSHFRFGHGATHMLRPGVTLFDSYHCSRYNTNTGRLTTEMFQTVFAAVRAHIDAS